MINIKFIENDIFSQFLSDCRINLSVCTLDFDCLNSAVLFVLLAVLVCCFTLNEDIFAECAYIHAKT